MSRAQLLRCAALMVVTWLGVNAVWSLTGDDTTAAAVWVEAVMPLGWAIALAAAILTLATAGSLTP